MVQSVCYRKLDCAVFVCSTLCFALKLITLLDVFAEVLGIKLLVLKLIIFYQIHYITNNSIKTFKKINCYFTKK